MKVKLNFRAAALAVACLLLAAVQISAQVQCLQDAWKSYNAGVSARSSSNNKAATASFEAAVQACNICITQFEAQAKAQQAALKKCPPVGAVSEADKKAIFANWALNDVATAAFVKGKAAEFLVGIDATKHKARSGDLQAAKKLVKELSYGRCWDPQGWFWSPCKALAGDGACCP
ncbi:MAG: hypothetical protein AAB316_19775 [Bacteroidota bacterium]